ncbi:ATP-grasp domain-containing protein [Streptomyces sp. SID161]|uniref:ATP-grasp domain-containing protein n=1 Tax=Streptomyces sp. SID161 TaxID=2690251 RepID=UPI001371D049|nr:ATP-grasp domain-containing protein [Streptomyces sp. SID161]MYW47265.1 ATP-grasp domain-containing protein [Streptomyces sp. SID161]
MTDVRRKTTVLLLDRIGYSFYRDRDGRRFLPEDRCSVRLVTSLDKVDEATGKELESVVAVDVYDNRALAEAVHHQAGFKGHRADRLVAITERLLLRAAELREELGLPGQTVREALLFRDKVRMKEHLSAHGIRVPEFAPFSEAAALELLSRTGAVVAKPRLGSGARDIFVLREPADIASFAAGHASRLDEFEVEEFIDGELFHVDSVVQDSKVVAAVAARYIDETTSYTRLRPCRDVALGPGPQLDALLEFNERVLAAHPGFTGVTHHEMFVRDGDIVFCEIGARAGGGGVIAGFLSRTGVNLDEAVIQAQVEGTVPLPAAPAGHLTGFTVIYAGAGVLQRPLTPPDEPWVLECQVLARPGDRLERPENCNDAVAIVSVRGDSEDEVIRRLDQVGRHMVPVLSPGD